MRWIVFAIVLFFVIVLQTALVPHIHVLSAWPDLPVLLAVHLMLVAPAPEAMLAAWIIGFAVDLNSVSYSNSSNIGVSALSYGLTALLVLRARRHWFRDQASTYFLFVLVAASLVHMLVDLHMLYVTDQMPQWKARLALSLGVAFYTTLLSPYAHWLLRRLRGALGIGPVQTLRVR